MDGDAGDLQKKACTQKHTPTPIFIRDDALASFDSLVDAVRSTNKPLYVIVDEYDRFANKLLFENREAYEDMVMGKSGKRGSSVLRAIFERVKKASGKFDSADAGGLPFRSFVVGLAPLAFSDASGPNIFTDITHEPNVAEMLGFTRHHLDMALEHLVEVFCPCFTFVLFSLL